MPAHRGHESAPQAETLYETVILTGLPPAWRKRPEGGGIVHPVDRGGRGALSVSGESGEHGVYRSPPQKTKKRCGTGGAAGVARPPCRGIPFQYVKIVQMSAEYAKLA